MDNTQLRNTDEFLTNKVCTSNEVGPGLYPTYGSFQK